MLTDGNMATGYPVLGDSPLHSWRNFDLEDDKPQRGAEYIRGTVRDQLEREEIGKGPNSERHGFPDRFFGTSMC